MLLRLLTLEIYSEKLTMTKKLVKSKKTKKPLLNMIIVIGILHKN